MLLHLMSLHFAIRLFRKYVVVPNISQLRYHQTVILILSAMMLLFSLHLLTNFGWGLFIYIAGALPNYREGIFYSLENYTSLGLTLVNVDDRWRMLAPMISMSGVFCLSWSTAVLVIGHCRLLHHDRARHVLAPARMRHMGALGGLCVPRGRGEGPWRGGGGRRR
mgnify:CR=1 FL=1